ncbi:MAG: aldehyde ferredoxin oxidoreductase family protein [Halanaerobiales bacterium]|nr:aldehyde ferredoxin oxidoreductase family protein [Halanaerobiales bacterium]
MYGYRGKLLEINLTDSSISVKKLDENLLKKYLGGSGLGARLLYDLTDGQTAPLDEENVLIFMTGPFTGTKIPTSGRHAVVTKSPLTGIWAEADVGGNWGYELKCAGFDGILIKGKAVKPVYLWISEVGTELRDATHLWGKDTYEVDELIRKETDSQAVISSIGQGGENLVAFASIMTDGKDGRAAGRGGVGAVMGSKYLKAIAVRGKQRVEVKYPERLKQKIKELAPEIVDKTRMFGKYGTSGGVQGHEEMLNFPLKNWAGERWPEGVEKINGIVMEETILKKQYRCKTCIIGCGRDVEITAGPYQGVNGAGPEYETIGTLGGLCMIDDLEAIAWANELCNRYGIDTISAGSVIAYSMEAFERGILTAEDCDGLQLVFGNEKAMIELIHKIANKEGYLGKLLSKGVRKAAAELGNYAEEFAIHVKGMEFPAHDPRAYNGVALSYATSNRGACHVQGFTHGFEKGFTMPELGIDQPHPRHSVEGKGEFTAKLQDLMCIFDSIKLCKFVIIGGVKLTDITELFNAVTGLNLTNQDLIKIGERIYNLKRLYNVRCGISRKDDSLPPRILTQKRGPNLPPLGKMLNEYYAYRKWDEFGVPTEAKIKELGLMADYPDAVL